MKTNPHTKPQSHEGNPSQRSAPTLVSLPVPIRVHPFPFAGQRFPLSASAPPREISLCVASLLRYAPVAPPGLHICLSLWTCAIARVFAPARLIRRFPNLLLLRSCLWQSISTFPRSRFALRAAFGRLPGQRPLTNKCGGRCPTGGDWGVVLLV